MGILPIGTSLVQIKDALDKKGDLTGVSIERTNQDDYFTIRLKSGNDFRCMSVFFGDVALYDHQIDGVLIKLGTNQLAKEVINYLVNEFGGYYLEEDGGRWQPLNIELYKAGREFTPMNLFTHKVIHKLGYSNLSVAIELLNEFKNL